MIRYGVDTMKKTLLSLGALALSMAGACAQPDEIDRKQPNLVPKSAFQGEWYLLDTIVEAPYAADNGFTGLQGGTARGAWVIEEDHLYFYRTYEFVDGIESQGIQSDTDTPLLDEDGEPVTRPVTLDDGTTVQAAVYVLRSTPLARYKIEGHFDVRKEYNPLTGEESNVRVEDTTEKYWWQREYMRVNFGADSAKNYERLTYVPEGYTALYEGEVANEDLQFRLEDDGTYMDFVSLIPNPAPSIWYDGYGWVPSCLFYPWWIGAYYECNLELMHVRTSYMRVPADNGYLPFQYDDQMLSKFGYYRSSRADWDELFGTSFSDAIHQIRRFDLWETWDVERDSNGQPVRDAETGEFQVNYANMTPKPIVYYLSEEFPRELIGGAIDLADQWNKPFMEVVSTHLTRAGAASKIPDRMFILCENHRSEAQKALASDPNAILAEVDDPRCLDMDRKNEKGLPQLKLLGDLRYNMLVSVNDPTQYGLGGYGPMNSDPLTGKTVHANAFQYTANIQQSARTGVDMIEYEAGVQTFRDIAQAEHITTKVKAKALQRTQRAPRAPASLEEAQAMANVIVPAESNLVMTTLGLETTDTNFAKSRMARILDDKDYDFAWLNADMAAAVGVPVSETDKQVGDPDGFLSSLVHPYHSADEDIMLWSQKQAAKRGAEGVCMMAEFDDSIRGLSLEYKAIYDKRVCEGLLAAGQAQDLVFDFSIFDTPGASCDAGTSACGANQVCSFLDQGEASGKYCITPCNVADLLQQLRDEIRRVNQIATQVYWDPNALYADVKDDRVRASQLAARALVEEVREEVYLDLFDRMWSTIAMHEVGHNVGLRHNFASSTDALNYFPEYWDLKGFTAQDGTYHPANLWERDTEAQAIGRMREFQQTSIMEYTGSFNARFEGLGAYDDAAIHFGYGGLLNSWKPGQGPNVAALEKKGLLDEPEDDDPANYGISVLRRDQPLARALRKVHHTNFPNVLGGLTKLQDESARELVPWTEVADTSKPCDLFDDPYDSSVCGAEGSYCQPFPTGFFCTKPDRVEVPFRFCSDEYNWLSPDCQTHDEGTDVFEMVTASIDDYENYWPFVAYKRDNDLFFPATSYWSYVQATMAEWRKHWEHWAYDYVRYNKGDWWQQKFGVPWHLDVNGGLGATLAAKEIFTAMANVFGRPSSGYYAWNIDAGEYQPPVSDGSNQYCNYVQIEEDQGARPIYASFDFNGYLYTPARAGTFYDRLAALRYMTYPQMMFVRGVDTNFDIQRFRINFADVWPQRTQNIFAGMLTTEPAAYGWCVTHGLDGDGAPVFDYANPCNTDPVSFKERKWFGTPEELAEYYADCVPLNPEPEYPFPTTQYRLPALAAIYGMGWLTGNYDRTFIDRSRLWLEGEGTDISIGEGFETISFTDKFSGKTYLADYDPAEYDPTERLEPLDLIPVDDFEAHAHAYWPAAKLVHMAQEAEKLPLPSAGYQFSELQQIIGRLEIVRGLYRTYEFKY